MSTEPDPLFKKTWGSDKKHSVVEADDVAHRALELAEMLEKKMIVNPLNSLGITKQPSWLGVWIGGIIALITLICAFVYLGNNQSTLAILEQKFLTGGLMIVATIGLGIYFISLSCMDILGNNLVFTSVFAATLALALSIFMIIVAIKSRALPK